MQIQECRRFRDQELGTFTALIQTFAADKQNKKRYIELIPQIARALHISEHLALQYCKRYIEKPKYIYLRNDEIKELNANTKTQSKQLQNQNQNDFMYIQQIKDVFVNLETCQKQSVLNEKYNKLNTELFDDMFDENYWEQFVQLLGEGGSQSEFMELREKMRVAAIKFIQNNEEEKE